MQINGGLIVVIGAVTFFYIRLILIQRERIKQVQRTSDRSGKNKSKKTGASEPRTLMKYSILSPKLRDRMIGLAGALLIGVGALLYAQVIPWLAAQGNWWIPSALGIVMFSWLFQL